MEITKDWDKIRKHFSKSFGSNLHHAIASVDAHHCPTVTPIGSLFLNSNQTGFYFEKFTTKLPQNGKRNDNICVLAVNSSKWFWLKALFNAKFSSYPAVRLYGKIGIKRKATEAEKRALSRRMRFTKRLKGQALLWSDMNYVRELTFTRAEKINIGELTAGL